MGIGEAANLLKISEWTIRGWVTAEKIPYTRSMGRVYVLKSIVDELLKGLPIERSDKVFRGRPSILRGGRATPVALRSSEDNGGGSRSESDPDPSTGT